MKDNYAYAVARIRSKEVNLLTKKDIDRLLTSSSDEEKISFLKSKGWGNENDRTLKDLLQSERDKTLDFIRELVPNGKIFKLFESKVDYINLKTVLRSIIMDEDGSRFFLSQGSISYETMMSNIKDKSYKSFSPKMSKAAKEAFEILLHTNDSQIADVLIDKASIEEMYDIVKTYKSDDIQNYVESFAALANIKTAVRGSLMNRNINFFKKAFVKCETLSIDSLSNAACRTLDDIYNYLSFTKYSDCIDKLKISLASFEKWCDNFLISNIKSKSRYDFFSITPIFVYTLLRQTEIRAVRMVFIGTSGKLNIELIKERLRDLYA